MDFMGQWNNMLSQFSNKQVDKSVSTAEFGDLIEFVQLWSGLSLWGVHVGNGHVLHFGVGDRKKMQKLGRRLFHQMTSSSAAAGAGVLQTRVCIQPITDLQLPPGTRVKVNNYRHGLEASAAAEISHRCHTFLDQEFKYDLLNFNSEHFATFVRFGLAVSNQNPFEKKDKVHTATTQTLEMIIQQRTETET